MEGKWEIEKGVFTAFLEVVRHGMEEGFLISYDVTAGKVVLYVLLFYLIALYYSAVLEGMIAG